MVKYFKSDTKQKHKEIEESQSEDCNKTAIITAKKKNYMHNNKEFSRRSICKNFSH